MVSQLSEYNYHRFGVHTFLENGYSVKLFDISPLLTSNYADIVVTDKKEGFNDYVLIHSVDELGLELEKYAPKNCLILFGLELGYRTFMIYRIFKKYSVDYAFMVLGNLPHGIHRADSLPLCAKIIRYIKLFSIRAICDKIFSLMPRKYYGIFGIMPAKYYLVSGMDALKFAPCVYISSKTTVINAHSMDYDRYLEMDLSKPADLDMHIKYCVFLDEYYPFHPDYILAGVKPPCSENKYYHALNRFFDYIEKKFNLSVIIAAHPKANYNLHPNAFPNRVVIYGKTNYLVRDAELVIMHDSTAINFSILFKKPILFITTDELKETANLNNEYISEFAEYFGQIPINIDEDYSSLCAIPNIDKELYDKYKNDYIKMKNTPEKKIWDIFIDEIEKN